MRHHEHRGEATKYRIRGCPFELQIYPAVGIAPHTRVAQNGSNVIKLFEVLPGVSQSQVGRNREGGGRSDCEDKEEPSNI